MSNTISRRDIDFLLYEMLDVDKLCEREYFSEHGRNTFGPMLDTAEDIARDHFATCAEVGDKNMAEIVDGKVKMVPEAKTAMTNLCEAGFIAVGLDNEFGGLQLPCARMVQIVRRQLTCPVRIASNRNHTTWYRYASSQ